MSEEESHWYNALVSYWQNNIKNNIKVISATLGSMITSLIGIVFFGLKEGLGAGTIGILLIFSLQPFFNIFIQIVFRGESQIQEQEKAIITLELDHQRNLSEYQLQLVAYKASRDWDDANNYIKQITRKEEIKSDAETV